MTDSAKLSPRVLIAFACVYFFWGSTYVAMRAGVAAVSPLALASTRFLIAGPLMLALCALRALPLRPSRRDLGFLVMIGVVMLGLGNMGCAWAEQYLSSGLASLLFAVIPLYVALLEAVLPRGERLRARGWLGIAVGLLGLAGLISPGLGAGRHTGQLLGSAIAVLAALAWSAASVLSRRARLRTGAFVSAAWQMLFGGLFDFALLLATGGSLRHVAWGRAGLASVVWLIVFGSLVGYTAYIYLLDHVPVAKVSTYAYINPIVAVLLGAIVLHERMVPIEYAGMGAIVVAVYLVTSSRLKAGASEPVAEPLRSETAA